VLQATNANPGADGSLAHLVGAAGVVPGVARNNLARIYANDARAWRMQTIIYYLADSARRPGESALWVYASPAYDGQVVQNELVTGVERMAITYGVDNDGADVAGNLSANRFLRSDAVANWGQVVSARVELLLVGSSDSQTAAAQTLEFAGENVTPNDRKLRTVMSMLVSLRNTVP
jgi:type IV pilus assembly protein PilW